MARVTYIFGKKLADQRASLLMTQKQVAAKANYSDESISRAEQKEIASILTSAINGLATALEVPIERFRTEFVVPLDHPALKSQESEKPSMTERLTLPDEVSKSIAVLKSAARKASIPLEQIISALRASDVNAKAAVNSRQAKARHADE